MTGLRSIKAGKGHDTPRPVVMTEEAWRALGIPEAGRRFR